MNMFEVWLILVFLPKLTFMFAPLVIVSAVSILAALLGWMVYSDNLRSDVEIAQLKEIKAWNQQSEIRHQLDLKQIKHCKKIFKIGVISLCLSSLMVAAVPNKKEMAAIITIPYISNNAEFKKLPENIVGVLNDLIKDYRKDLSPSKVISNNE